MEWLLLLWEPRLCGAQRFPTTSGKEKHPLGFVFPTALIVCLSTRITLATRPRWWWCHNEIVMAQLGHELIGSKEWNWVILTTFLSLSLIWCTHCVFGVFQDVVHQEQKKRAHVHTKTTTKFQVQSREYLTEWNNVRLSLWFDPPCTPCRLFLVYTRKKKNTYVVLCRCNKKQKTKKKEFISYKFFYFVKIKKIILE